MSLISRRRWYFEQQVGVCALRCTEACRTRGGAMEFQRPDKGKAPKKATATWDHIFPRTERRPHEGHVQMLVCYACNNKRGATPATPEYIAIAQVLLDRWKLFRAHQLAEVEQKRALRASERARQRIARMQRAVAA